MFRIIATILGYGLLATISYAALTNGYTPVTKNGAANPPTVQNGSIFDTGTSSGFGNVGIGSTAPGATLDVGGGTVAIGHVINSNWSDMSANLTNTPNAISTSTNLVSGDKWNIVTASGALTETLPSPVAGEVVAVGIGTTSTNLVTVSQHSSENIDGQATRIMWAGESAILRSDGTNWFKMAGRSIPMAAEMSTSAPQTIGYNSVTNVAYNTANYDNTGLMVDVTNNRAKCLRSGTYVGQIYSAWGNSAFSYNDIVTWGYMFTGGSGQFRAPLTAGSFPTWSLAVVTAAAVAGDYATGQAYHAGYNAGNGTLTSIFYITEVPTW